MTEYSIELDGLFEKMVRIAEDSEDALRMYIQDLIDEPYPPASEPFTPPHRRSGDLQASVRTEIRIDRDAMKIELVASSPVEYADYLENGTAKMAPRPVWAMALRTWSADLTERIMNGL